ncbi:MAG: hypothetical protein AAGG79_00540 [Pseudomonadota bacterium]
MTDQDEQRSGDKNRNPVAYGLGAAAGSFIVGTVALSVAIYLFGMDASDQQAFSGSEMDMFNVTSNAAFGMASAVVGLLMGLLGAVTAVGALVMGIGISFLGLAGAIIVAAGIIAGPILLATGVYVVIKRRYYPDVI